jgi:hypothetical protein
MIRALVWKEYREQRFACLGITGLGMVLLAGVARWLEHNRSQSSLGTPAAFLLAGGAFLSWCYGVVGGAMVLAGEREDGTLPFLDTLPARRGRLWRAKGLATATLLLAQAALVVALLAALGAVTTAAAAAGAFASAVAAGVVGLGWGLAGSARSETVMGAITRAALSQALVAGLLTLVLTLAWVATGFAQGAVPLQLLGAFLLGACALTVAATTRSAWAFGEPDRLRAEAPPPARVPTLAALAWLVFRQTRAFGLVMACLGLAGGLAVLEWPLFAWPLLTLVLGVVCGLRAFQGEEGARGLLAERRLPAGRLWLARVGGCGLIAVAACLMALAAPVARLLPGLLDLGQPSAELRADLLVRLFGIKVLASLTTPGLFLPLGLAYGFAAGTLSGMLLRRFVTAALAAVLVALTGVAVWLPSLVGGGLHPWQVLLAPAALLLTSRLLLPVWATGELTARRRVALASSLTLAATCTAAGIWYRVVELPPPPPLLEPAAWLARLPDPETDDTGRLTRAALAGVVRRQRELPVRPDKALFPRFELAPASTYDQELSLVLQLGWPGGEPELSGWLDRMFADPWTGELARAANGPPGLVVDPREEAPPLRREPISEDQVGLAAGLLAVRGLRQQARGDHRAYADQLHIGLALARNLRFHSSSRGWFKSRPAEGILMVGLSRWLERVGDRREALRAVLEVLRDHDARYPRDPADAAQANYLIALNSLPNPRGWAGSALASTGATGRRLVPEVGWLWQAPWEQARQARALAWLFTPRPPAEVAECLTWPCTQFPLVGLWHMTQVLEPPDLTVARGRMLQVALRLYRAARGHDAPSLAALVPDYLPAVPADPLDPAGGPFHYRLSRGETIWLPPTLDPRTGKGVTGHRHVPAGHGILWSVGNTGRQEGQRVFVGDKVVVFHTDWLFPIDPPDVGAPRRSP